MIPERFEYVRAATRPEAFDALADPESSAIAGGHSIVPMMKLRLASPSRLVDIAGLDFRGTHRGVGEIRIGALTTYDELLRSGGAAGAGALVEACTRVGDVQVRNAGTLGGALAHADPAGDLAAAMLALETRLVLDSARGGREVPTDGFFTGPFTTALGPAELLVELVVPQPADHEGSAYVSEEDPASGYPLAGAAVRVRLDGARIVGCSIGLTGVATRPFRLREVEALVVDEGRVPAPGEIAGRLADLTPLEDVAADAAYRRHLAAVVVARATARATARAQGTAAAGVSR